MIKTEISNLIKEKHNTLFHFLEEQDDSKWKKGPEGKWTTGQQVLHLIQSAQFLNKALGMPKFLLRYKFGKSNRSPRAYEAIIKRYNERLASVQSGTFGPSQNMRIPTLSEKDNLISGLKQEHEKLQKHIKKWSDTKLDTLLLPHPLMGRMPVREIIMWSAYHVEHHTKALLENYS